jgi:hypothetical protein
MSTALMIRIDHTTSPVVTMTAKKAFTLAAKTVDTRTREIVADAPVDVAKGAVLHFVASSLPGWYYVGRTNGTAATCTCPSRGRCKHQAVIMARHEGRKCPVVAPVVFRVGGKEVRGTNAAEALLKALCLVKRPVVVSQLGVTCQQSGSNLRAFQCTRKSCKKEKSKPFLAILVKM